MKHVLALLIGLSAVIAAAGLFWLAYAATTLALDRIGPLRLFFLAVAIGVVVGAYCVGRACLTGTRYDR